MTLIKWIVQFGKATPGGDGEVTKIMISIRSDTINVSNKKYKILPVSFFQHEYTINVSL